MMARGSKTGEVCGRSFGSADGSDARSHPCVSRYVSGRSTGGCNWL